MQDIYKKEAIKAAKEAGKIQLRYFETGIAKKAKKDDSFVTKADIESTKAIRNILGKNFPDHTLKCEELGTTRKNSDYKWIIDPLDGTHNFIIDNPLFGVSIALKHKDEVILGVINMPVLGKMYHAQKGKGAYCNGKKINVSKMNRLDKSLFIFDSKLRSKTDVKMGIMRRLAEKTWRMRSYGVSVYNNLLVAEGKA
ncbi:MAG: inositol monophosphatase family protein, partial [Nanoarchaeota archaeon]